jgi:hypothetical protein
MPEQADGRPRLGRCFTNPGSILEFEALTRAGVREEIASSLADQPVPLPLDRVRQDRLELPSSVSVTPRSAHPEHDAEMRGSVHNPRGEVPNPAGALPNVA